mmetsp:Transcript_4275/g.9234  ORF Transcript_4275/g.9234 Transcript_4275/m.9234 type:complete len:206 (+) Transcript_4275:2829-3446(+)
MLPGVRLFLVEKWDGGISFPRKVLGPSPIAACITRISKRPRKSFMEINRSKAVLVRASEYHSAIGMKLVGAASRFRRLVSDARPRAMTSSYSSYSPSLSSSSSASSIFFSFSRASSMSFLDLFLSFFFVFALVPLFLASSLLLGELLALSAAALPSSAGCWLSSSASPSVSVSASAPASLSSFSSRRFLARRCSVWLMRFVLRSV